MDNSRLNQSNVTQEGSSQPKPPSKPRKRFVGRTTMKPSTSSSTGTSAALLLSRQIPTDILEDPLLNAAIAQLPANYSFEIHKTIHHVRKNEAKCVALQMPEGLQMFACAIADIIERFTSAVTVIMGDVTYGACCIDDYTAIALGCDMLVHYGHSCLVPIATTTIKTLYIFVEIGVDAEHLHQTVRLNFSSDRKKFREELIDEDAGDRRTVPIGRQIGSAAIPLQIEASVDTEDRNGKDEDEGKPKEKTRLALVSTIQFVAALQKLKDDLSIEYSTPESQETIKTSGLITGGTEIQTTLAATYRGASTGAYEASIPRSKPLSPGEILGCTAPKLGDEVDAIIYLGDGRFHLEAIMIANPGVPAFRYDPYSKKFTREWYDHGEMRRNRSKAIETARQTIRGQETENDSDKKLWGLVLGTLGRQGSLPQLEALNRQIAVATSKTPIQTIPILLSELSPAKLSLFEDHISTFVQTSCPRLSIDWGYAFSVPLLSPYETAVAVGRAKGWGDWKESGKDGKDGIYPMDFYEGTSWWAASRIKGAAIVET